LAIKTMNKPRLRDTSLPEYYQPTAVASDRYLGLQQLQAITDKRPPLSREGLRLAILVYQGSGPTKPYPTLVIRQSATLAFRLFASDTDEVVRPLGWIGAT
jgi:hypothetical protein